MLALVAAVAIRLVTGFVGVSLAVCIVRSVARPLHLLLRLLRPTGLPCGAAVDISSASSSSRTPLLSLAHVDTTIEMHDIGARRFLEWAGHLAQRSSLP